MFIAIAWIGFALVVGAAASGRGRSAVLWLLLALIISPLIAGLVLAVLPDLKTQRLLERAVSGEDYAASDRDLERSVRRDRKRGRSRADGSEPR